MHDPDPSTAAEPSGTPVRRADDGSCSDTWHRSTTGGGSAQAVFGGVLGIGDTAAAARALVERDGLASLVAALVPPVASPDDEWEVVVVQEAWPGRAIVVEGPYALAGMPTVEISGEDLAAGVEMTLSRRTTTSPSSPPAARSRGRERARTIAGRRSGPSPCAA